MAQAAARTAAHRRQGLFPCEAEVARRLSQSPSEWAAKALVLERAGLPRIDPVMGGRFWPAVDAFWRKRYGLTTVEASALDGVENLDAL
ncbi:hypothetical protein MCBMB27_02598 [Methylobacterium phyllosphaerae]|uniref:Winged helix-turn-helix domain-containing protein n=1 Tax=Methylobacterium phyllosphaerae TaxID=418223 RepID=A0AAE8HSK2_9HYPH|nr:hypothetical protein [Methylobacterium phyllosphaerae]APT31889.1 hypothetical protein MCBMB27_02598 [Methylobacterium phyllosphaerae]SFH02059.1 hypothetical protein SAMN05192567_11269 [Methylobacterium phyllosphaerae]